MPYPARAWHEISWMVLDTLPMTVMGYTVNGLINEAGQINKIRFKERGTIRVSKN